MILSDVGKLMHLPIADIKPGKSVQVSAFVLQAAATALQKANGRNWVPLIVKQIDHYAYEVISNGLVYAVATAAGLERIWCIVTDASPETIELTQILAGEQLPKVNLNTASRDEIQAALQFISEQPTGALKGIDVSTASEKIFAANRQDWQDFLPISKLGKFKIGALESTITKGKKLDAFAEVFYLSPIIKPMVAIDPPATAIKKSSSSAADAEKKSKRKAAAPKASATQGGGFKTISIKKATRNEIFQQLKLLAEAEIAGFEKLDLDKAADEIFTEPKGRWSSLNPIAKLNCGLNTNHTKALKQVFTL